MKEELIAILKEVRPDVDFEQETALIDGGILDSFDIVTLVAELNDTFDITVGVENLIPQNFNSADAMLAMIQRLQDED